MGDPRSIRRKYSGPSHPWEGSRIELEKKLIRDFGLKNKKEIWKMESQLTAFKDQVKKLTVETSAQAEKEKAQLREKLQGLGLLKEGSELNDVLAFDINELMERRLQSIVCRMGLAHSMKQARQFITHRHVTVNGQKITVPSYLVKEGEVIGFSDRSVLDSETHPERLTEKPVPKPKPEAPAEGEVASEATEEAPAEPVPEPEAPAEETKEEKVEEAVEAPKEEKPAKEAEEKPAEGSEEKKEEKTEPTEAPKEEPKEEVKKDE